jgi:hypothetical protein
MVATPEKSGEGMIAQRQSRSSLPVRADGSPEVLMSHLGRAGFAGEAAGTLTRRTQR